MTPARRCGGPAALVAAALAWGSTIVTIKVAARGVPVPTIAVIEVLAALVVLVAVLARRRNLPRRPPVALLVGGLLEPGLAYPLLNSGLARTSGTHGSLIIGLESVIVVLLGALSDRRAPSRRTLAALGLAAAGAASLVGGAGGTASVSGDLLVAAGVGCAAGYVALVRHSAETWDPVELTAYQFAAGSFAILPIAAVSLAAGSGAVLGHASGWQVASAVTAGVVGSAMAFLLYNWALGRVPTALAGTSLTLIPVFGVAFSVALLDEALTARTVVAACAVLAGVALAASEGAPVDAAPSEPTAVATNTPGTAKPA